MEKRLIIVFIILAVVVLAGVLVYLFYSPSCSDLNCFNSALEKCSKAKFVSEAAEASYLYDIKGKAGEDCRIDVELLQLKKGDVKYAVLESKKMNCYLPYGVVAKPELNLDRCHGLLKEELQAMIINKLHNYILDNLGKISEELKKPL